MAGLSDAIPNSLPGKDRCFPRLFMWTAKIAVPNSTAALNANSHVVCTYYSSHRCRLAQWLCIIVLVDSIHLLKLWATIKYLGRSRMENLIDMHLDLTAQTQAAIEAEPDLVLLNQKSTYYSGHSTHSKLCSNHKLKPVLRHSLMLSGIIRIAFQLHRSRIRCHAAQELSCRPGTLNVAE